MKLPWAAILAGIVAIAVALRLWGIYYGLPWLFYFHDEPQVVLRALRFGTGDLNPHFFIWPGVLLLYLAFVSFGALFLFGRVMGWWAGRDAFAAAYFQDPTAFYLLPRLQSVAFGAWGVWLSGRLGAEAFSMPVGIAAALGLALNATHGHFSHFAHPVTAMTAFTIWALWASLRVAQHGSRRDLWLGGLAIGLGVSAQYHAGVALIPLGVAVLAQAGAASGAARARWLARGAGAALLAAATYLLLSPYTLLDFKAFWGDLTWIAAKTAGEIGGKPRGLLEGLVAFGRSALIPALGMPLAVAAGLGALWALRRRTRADWVLVSYLAAYALVGSRAWVLGPRYAVPLVAPALILAARCVEAAGRRLGLRERALAWGVPIAVLALCAPVGLELIRTDSTMARSDTRVESLAWFEEHVPADARVVIDMLRFWNTASPPLAENRERLLERLAESRAGLSGAGHSAVYAEYYRYRLENPKTPAYYLLSTQMGADVRPLEEYRRRGFGWAVVSDEAVGFQRTRAAGGDSTGLAYYLALEREATEVAVFEPAPWKRLGPTIRIYRLEGGAARPQAPAAP